MGGEGRDYSGSIIDAIDAIQLGTCGERLSYRAQGDCYTQPHVCGARLAAVDSRALAREGGRW